VIKTIGNRFSNNPIVHSLKFQVLALTGSEKANQDNKQIE
jgi:hypothetical protein